MIITTLIENSSISKEYKIKHGLCLHIKTKEHSILFDLGPDDTFIKNAEKLNIDIKDVDIVIISHGHKDHGGGLEAFLKYNDKAKVYISKHAFDDHYVSVLKFLKVYVGLNKELKDNNRIILTDEIHKIDDNLTLISNISGNLLVPSGNKSILVKENEKYNLDKFEHEQNLLLNESGENFLFAGCSHAGILNIIQQVEEKTHCKIDYIIGGLHLYNPVNMKTESLDFINELGTTLMNKNAKIYTCHCTGKKAYSALKNILENNIETLKTGQVVELMK